MLKPPQETATPGHPPGTVIDGRYRVIRYIGQGGAGLVHEVEHLLTGRRLAMKTLHEEAGYGRLEQEAKATSAMKNTHAVKITDMGSGKGGAGAYLVMELLDGQSLRERLDYQKRLPIELTINLALQVCECLAEAHALGIIHRDLKPDNIFLSPSPLPGQHDVKVLDFGVVKISGEGPIPHASLTRTGSTVGTPYYMSLEQLRNSSAVDARADIYSLGVLLYECLTGRTPFEQAETFGDLIYALCSGPPKPVAHLRPDTPAELGDVVMRALSVEREDRQASMTEIAKVLAPLGNPAFGLWLRTEATDAGRAGQGGAPGVSRRMLPAAGTPARPQVEVQTPATPDEPEWDTTTTTLKPDPRAILAELKGDATTTTLKPDPRALLVDPESEGIQVVMTTYHGSEVVDRDTPTRALPTPIRAPELERPAPMYRGNHAAPYAPPPPPPMRPGPQPSNMDGQATLLLAPLVEQTAPYGAVAPIVPASPVAPDEMQTARLEQPVFHSTPDIDELSFKPAWKRALDGAVSRIGAAVTGFTQTAKTRFFEASPGEQLALAVGGASLFAALLVLLLYLVFS
ncbi:serine/threonine-protein kinase [Chondromyces crocatus]|uniref:Protein kinase domain-containing protein n=1 Tax=Chondromyces crocatus TaxID=52 RepID=A0A0K1EMV9_CHOCO|nr:serine/threonine-protein kinase [Chondromyces crocatus]AKT41992.1 uncharacterized protein CMC5_062140 [Chondromyces crocatus]